MNTLEIKQELLEELSHYNFDNPYISKFVESFIFNDLVEEVKDGISSLDYMKREVHKVLKYEIEAMKIEDL